LILCKLSGIEDRPVARARYGPASMTPNGRSSSRLAVLVGLIAALGPACDGNDGAAGHSAVADGPDAAPDASLYGAPRADLVPPVGSEDTLDIAAWNIENFPASPSTPRLVADLIASLDLDLVAVEEIADVDAFDELVARLPGYRGLLSSHTYGDGSYQKVGFVYRDSLVDLAGGSLLFGDQGYDFPRPPLQVEATVDGHAFVAIAIHLKAGVEREDRERRTAALATLAGHLRDVEESSGVRDVLALGDFNQTLLDEPSDADVWGPIVADATRYDVLSRPAAEDGEVSYLPFGGHLLDHGVASTGFVLGTPEVVVPHLDEQPIDYTDLVSDHRPIVFRFPR
jgi:endonuclease/exonuclease/phosphatase family metal-dependent hydrolase